MGQWILDEDIDRSRDNIISGRAKLALPANDFTFFVMVNYGGPLGPIIQLRPRNFFQGRQIFDQLIDTERIAGSQLANEFIHTGGFPKDIHRAVSVEAISRRKPTGPVAVRADPIRAV